MVAETPNGRRYRDSLQGLSESVLEGIEGRARTTARARESLRRQSSLSFYLSPRAVSSD
jgi:hypothetical protein